MSNHLWKWQWQLHTKAIMLLLLRPDWLRKNQIIWQNVTPWSLKEFCLLKGQPCRKRSEILHESYSRAKKHRTQHLLFSRIRDFNSHCGQLWRSFEMTVRKAIIKSLWVLTLYKRTNHVTQREILVGNESCPWRNWKRLQPSGKKYSERNGNFKFNLWNLIASVLIAGPSHFGSPWSRCLSSTVPTRPHWHLRSICSSTCSWHDQGMQQPRPRQPPMGTQPRPRPRHAAAMA